MPKLVLIRHGQSIWNKENRFTGWVDVPLSEEGEAEARKAAESLRGMPFDVAYTSALRRAQDTLTIILKELDLHTPVIRDQALNERMYGNLQGLNKDETRMEYGDEQVKLWRRSYAVAPPGGESLKETAARVLPFFERCIMGDIRQGKNVLISAHGNSNRAIVMKLDALGPQEVVALELATGVPLVYDIASDGSVASKSILEHS